MTSLVEPSNRAAQSRMVAATDTMAQDDPETEIETDPDGLVRYLEEDGSNFATDAEAGTPVVLEGPSTADEEPALPYPVVGIGGSAGALEALIAFFPQLSPDTGMSFVVLSHLAPQQQSHLVEIVQRLTPMRVVSMEDGMTPEQNRVHVLPPNALASLEQGRFHLKPRNESGVFLPIDLFFSSLASSRRRSLSPSCSLAWMATVPSA